MYEFQYHKPSSIDEVKEIISSLDDPKIMAGGMTLIPTMKQRLAAPSDIIDLSEIKELRGISKKDNNLIIGSMTTHYEVHNSELVNQEIPSLAYLAGLIGDPMVRHRGTIGGSIANSDPSADYPSSVISLGAKIITDKREIDADNFFVDLFETALEENELILSISFPIPKKSAYEKFPQPASRYALVGVFVSDTDKGIRVGVTGAGPCAFRVPEMEKELTNNFSEESIKNVNLNIDVLNSDIHASSEYRAHLVKVMAKRAIKKIS